MSESYLRAETANEFISEQLDWLDRLHKASTREEKIYERKDLQCYSQILACLPMRPYKEMIPNL